MQFLVLILLLLAPVAVHALYQMIRRHIRAQAPVDLEHQRVFYGHIPEACPYCASKDLEHLGNDRFRCRKCV